MKMRNYDFPESHRTAYYCVVEHSFGWVYSRSYRTDCVSETCSVAGNYMSNDFAIFILANNTWPPIYVSMFVCEIAPIDILFSDWHLSIILFHTIPQLYVIYKYEHYNYYIFLFTALQHLVRRWVERLGKVYEWNSF